MNNPTQVPSKEMNRQDALRILGGWAMWSSPNEPDAELRSAARAVLHDRLALIRQLEEMRVAAATAAQQRAENEPGARYSELELAAAHYVKIAQNPNLSRYITENGRHPGSGGPWAELVTAVEEAMAAQSKQPAPPPADVLHQIKRTAELSAGIMRDRERTGGWEGAERVARQFDRIAKLASSTPTKGAE